MPAANRTADGCPRARAEQAAADRALARVVGVRAPGQSQDEGSRNNAGSDQSLHLTSFRKARRNNGLDAKLVPVDICTLFMRSNLSIEFRDFS
jgi:hypothetical protein